MTGKYSCVALKNPATAGLGILQEHFLFRCIAEHTDQQKINIFLITKIMSKEFRQIIPKIPPAAEIFASYQMAYEFRREAEYRQELKIYCEWYQLTAQSNRQELAKMRRDINIFGWFNRRKR